MNEEELFLNIGIRIKQLREERGMQQQDLGALCNLNKSAMSRIEAGNINSTIATLNKIAIAFDLPIKTIFDFTNND